MAQGNAFEKSSNKHSEKVNTLTSEERNNLTEAIVKGFKKDFHVINHFVLELVDKKADFDGYVKREKGNVQVRKQIQDLSRYKVNKANKAIDLAVAEVEEFSERVIQAVKSGERETIISTVSEGLKSDSVRAFFKYLHMRFPIDQDPRPITEQPPVLFVNDYVVTNEVDYRRVLRMARREKAMDIYSQIVSGWSNAKAAVREEIEKAKAKVNT